MSAEFVAVLERASRALQLSTKTAAVLRTQSRLQAKFAAIFKAQGNEFVASLRPLRQRFDESGSGIREAITDKDWEPLFRATLPKVEARMLQALRDESPKAMKDGVVHQASLMGIKVDEAKAEPPAPPGTSISFSLKNPRAVAYLEEHGAALVKGINETSKDQLATIMARQAKGGWSLQRTQGEIAAKFTEFSTSRAMTIARTESAYAYEAGNRAVIDEMVDAGLPMEKAWLDAGADDVCAENNGDGWIPVDDDFTSGDSEPPAHPNCICTTEYQMIGTPV